MVSSEHFEGLRQLTVGERKHHYWGQLPRFDFVLSSELLLLLTIIQIVYRW